MIENDGCFCCGKYAGAGGILTAGPDGSAVLVCVECDALGDTSRSCPIDRAMGAAMGAGRLCTER